MAEYFVSIPDADLKGHSDYERLSTHLGDPVIWEHKHTREDAARVMGIGDDSRLYFHSDSDELGEVIDTLISGAREGSTLIVQKAMKETLPDNIRKMLENLVSVVSSE